jgi:20S proteasome subunit alpha 1
MSTSSQSSVQKEDFIKLVWKEINIEYAFKAVKTANITSLGLRGKDCVVLLAEKKVTDRFIDPATVTNLHNVSTRAGCITTGLVRKNFVI